MTLQTIIDGSLPDRDVRVAVPTTPAPPPKPKKSRKNPARWTAPRIAAKIGVGLEGLRSAFRNVPEVREALYVNKNGRCDAWCRGVTEADVVRIAPLVLQHIGMWFAWAPKLKLAACVVCNTADFQHHHAGRCRRCYSHEKRAARGAGIHEHLGSWDRVRGLVACLVCHRSDEPHCALGMCTRCRAFHQRAMASGLGPRRYVYASARRRALVAKGNAKKGRRSFHMQGARRRA